MVSLRSNKLSIILVEDNPTFAQAVRQYLGLLGRFEVVGHALSGQQAISLTQNQAPDLLLMDISLGSMSGFDVAKAVNELENPPNLIFLTMHDQPAYREQAHKLGALGLVSKDQFLDDLPPLLDRLLESTAMAAKAALAHRG